MCRCYVFVELFTFYVTVFFRGCCSWSELHAKQQSSGSIGSCRYWFTVSSDGQCTADWYGSHISALS